MPPPDEWEKEMHKMGRKTFPNNQNQIQALDSMRCGYYCLLFLNEHNRGVSFTAVKASKLVLTAV